jgi:cytoskeletal protein CcmA (bactofilin family)
MPPAALLAAALLLAWGSALLHADVLQTGELYVLPSSDRAEGPMVVLANSAQLAGTASDDVFVLAGRQAELTGDCLNDAWVFAQTVQAGGVIRDHGRFAGFAVTISGVVSGGVAAAGNSVTVSREARLHRHAFLAGENVICEGTVSGPLRIAARRVTLGGEIRGNVDLAAEDIVIMPGTVIRGDLSYLSPNELLPGKTVTIEGALTRRQPLAPPEPQGFSLAANVLVPLLLLVSACAAGIPFLVIFPAYAGRCAAHVRDRFFRSAFVGALACCLLPMLGTMSLFSVVGLPLGLSLLGVFGLLAYFAKFVVALAAGAALLRRGVPRARGASIGVALLGLLLLYIGAALPIMGPAIALAAVFLGTGGLLLGLDAGGDRGPRAVEPPQVPGADSGGVTQS